MRRIPVAGVECRDAVLHGQALGITAPADSVAALELGLASEVVIVRGRRILLPPWVTSSARPLPSGVLRAVATTAAHVGAGASAGLALGAAAVLAGGVSGSLELAGLGTAVLVVLGSLVLHEAAHVVAYRLARGPEAPATLVVRGLRVHVVRVAGAPASDAVVAAAGAIGPLAAAAVLWSVVGLAPFLVLLSTLVALGHAVALALPFGDGATLRALARGGSGRRPDRTRPGVSVAGTATRRRSRRRAG